MKNDYLKTYEQWLNSPLLNEEEINELKEIKDNTKEIEDRFYQDLEFGTAGLRGIMEIGTNRMNRFIIAKTSQGLANYLLAIKPNNSVAIGYDSRNNSYDFAKATAASLASNGIKVYLYDELMPTPTVSYAVRYYKCDAGVMITASHNPSKYNGYKVYDSFGCQCTSEASNAILAEIEKLDVFKDVKQGDYDSLLKENMIETISNECFESYIQSTLKQSIYDEKKVLKVVYTPLYGAGRRCVLEVLKRQGFNHLEVVKEQELPNGDFPTCPYPNPELKDALKLGIDKLLETDSDILVATDPDSDRVGVAVNQNGKVYILSGNEIGLLCFESIYNARKENNTLTDRPVLVKTIVTSDLANIMAKKLGVTVKEVLTGFKYIGDQIHLLEIDNNEKDYLLGFEDSCGYLTNTNVRDKDAVNAVLIICEIANHLKLNNMTLKDKMDDIYNTYGEFKNKQLTYEFSGIEGLNKIQSIMNAMRSNEVKEVIQDVVSIGDYKAQTIINGDKVEPTNLPVADVVKFFISDNSTITIRPSGTEPKLKVYVFANGEARVNELKERIDNIVNSI